MIRVVGVVVACLLIVCPKSRGAENASEMLGNVKQKYDSIHDAEIKFTQHAVSGNSKSSRTASGTLWIKKDNKYRLEMGATSVVTDGVTVWSFTATSNRVLIDHYKEDNRTITPEKLIASAPSDYTPSFAGNETIGKVTTQILKLVPNEANSTVQELKLWVDRSTWLMKKVEITDFSRKKTTYVVTSMKINSDIPDSRFTFQVPEGVEAVDLR